MSEHIAALAGNIDTQLGARARRVGSLPGELTLEVAPADLLSVAKTLRDAPGLQFDTLIDICGVDYLNYGRDEWQTNSATRSGFSRGVDRNALRAQEEKGRYAVVYHLLSVALNHRVRVRVHCTSNDDPMIDSVTGIWPAANWFEREAFDLFGVLFGGHPDLRRILTDYGFIGHPFRKDFPLIGNVEVRYDEAKQRVVYEPVTIEPRTLVPRVIRGDRLSG
ncbi:MAG: NADH-quinone oxidoreductase chain 5 [Steroidobacteraceae bacterium]|nr:NADH-quinone oxidoreductase chain 5 [Steroidobacteraceae bacterium]